MSTSNTGKAGFDFSGLIATISSQPDPLRYLVQYLQAQRLPAQGPLFHIQAYVGLGVHGCIIVVILAATWVRSRRDQLWFTRKQQGRLRLNATVIGILFLAIYSSMAVAYTCLLLQQQRTGRYLAGSAAFQMSCFSAISFCVSVIAFTYHQSLPVGFESSFFRKVFHKRHAAEDSRFFSFAFLCIWLIISLAGLMTFPIIHDYWRRQIDSNIQGLITYLERQDVRERGLSALLGVVDQFSNLPHQVHQAQLALRRQLLVYIAHCGLYLLVIVPVAFKLISLLNKQMEALRRSAEDYFRLGTRLNQAPKAKDRSAAKQPLLEMPSQNGRMHVNDKITCPKIAITPCDNRDHDLPVSFAFAKQNPPERGEFIATRRPPVPRYELHPDFPLHKLQRLKRVRLELAGFSAVIIIGLVNFMAWTCVAYGSTPGWTSSQVTLNLFVISLWSYAIPAGISCVFYAYTTALSAKPASSRSSSAASQRSGPSKSSCSGRTLFGWLPFVKSGSRSQAWGQTNATTANGFRLLDNKRSRPTFPRMPSTLSFGGPLTPALDMEVLAKAKECEYPVVRSTTETLQWVEEQKRVCAKDVTIRAPSPSLASRVSLGPLRTMSRSRAMPASMTQSWLEIDED